MKKLITLAALAAALVAIAPQSYGQAYGVITPTITVNGVNAGESVATSCVFDVRKQKDIAINIASAFSDAGNSNTVYTFYKSLDGTTWSTVTSDHFTWTIAGNGTNVVRSTANFDVGAIGWIKIGLLANDHATSYTTNIVVKYAIKTKAD